MKHIFFLSWLCIIFFYSCTDPQVIGLEIQPETDKITISSLNDDSPFIASTQKVDSVRSSQTVYALLGKYESTSLLDARNFKPNSIFLLNFLPWVLLQY